MRFERLQTSSHKLAEVLYSQAGAATGGEGPADEQQLQLLPEQTATEDLRPSDDNVIDAEYVDVEDERSNKGKVKRDE
jgi:hypothetical protein